MKPWPALAVLAACAPPPAATVTLTFGARAGLVSDEFLSVAVDSAHLTGGEFWAPGGDTIELRSGTHRAAPLDFTDPELIRRARALSPGYLRLGGSAADDLDYGEGGDPEWRLTEERWSQAVAFARAAGLKLFFTLNAGPRSRDASHVWQPALAERFLQLPGAGDVAVWELGNEINGFPLLHGFDQAVSPEQYAKDLARARATVPGPMAGPSSAFWPVVGEMNSVLPRFMEAGAGGADVVTWHYYPQQSRRCPFRIRLAALETLLDPGRLDDVQQWADQVERLRDRHASHAEVWLGETGHAQCGGEPGVSGRWVSALWWADLLGQMARRGMKVVVRQSLVGSDYGLLDEGTFRPRPDYWVSLLWKRLVPKQALEVTSSDPLLRAYAACGVVVLINLDTRAPRSVALGGREWRLESDALDSAATLLDGRPLTDAPPLDAPHVDTATVAPAGITFLAVDGAPECCPPSSC